MQNLMLKIIFFIVLWLTNTPIQAADAGFRDNTQKHIQNIVKSTKPLSVVDASKAIQSLGVKYHKSIQPKKMKHTKMASLVSFLIASLIILGVVAVIAGIVFLALQLGGIIMWPWLWVLSPIWLGGSLALLILLVTWILGISGVE